MSLKKIEISDWLSEPFGSRRPPQLFASMIRYLHRKNHSLLPRILAPIVRKLVINYSALPIDVDAGDFSLRCQFTDNYSEKKYVFTPWRYDFQERLELTKALPKDGVFIDIGANIGLYTLTAARALSTKGTILSFEPNPLALERLSINLAANQDKFATWPNVKLLNVGISDENAERMLQIDDHNLGACSIVKTSQSQIEQSVQCRLLIDVLNEYDITRIDVLKIDIEGYEDVALVPFLNSADDSLLPGLIIIEDFNEDQWKQDLFSLLSDKGYRKILKTRLNSVLKRDFSNTH